jgi:hypothetical protein
MYPAKEINMNEVRGGSALLRVMVTACFVVAAVSMTGAFAGENNQVRADEPSNAGNKVFGVTVMSDGSPFPGVLISLSGGGVKQRTVSASDGKFEFSAVPPGEYTVVFQVKGKKKVERKIPVATEDVNMGTVLID